LFRRERLAIELTNFLLVFIAFQAVFLKKVLLIDIALSVLNYNLGLVWFGLIWFILRPG